MLESYWNLRIKFVPFSHGSQNLLRKASVNVSRLPREERRSPVPTFSNRCTSHKIWERKETPPEKRWRWDHLEAADHRKKEILRHTQNPCSKSLLLMLCKRQLLTFSWLKYAAPKPSSIQINAFLSKHIWSIGFSKQWETTYDEMAKQMKSLWSCNVKSYPSDDYLGWGHQDLRV